MARTPERTECAEFAWWWREYARCQDDVQARREILHDAVRVRPWRKNVWARDPFAVMLPAAEMVDHKNN